jgi:hypothetical protein
MNSTEICGWGNYRVMRFLPGDLNAARRLYDDLEADGISLSSRDGCSAESLDILRDFKGLKILLIRGLPDMKMDGLQYLPDLVELSLDETTQSLDFSMLPTLRKLSADWNKNLLKNAHLSGLTALRISKYKSVKNDLSDFPNFPALRELELVQSTVTSLNGISRFAGLRRIELHHLTKLEKLGELNLPELTAFVADVCKRLNDHNQLSACTTLEELKLHECGALKSVRFVDFLRKLKTFRFMKTDVLDGDLSPLLRLDDVYFTEKRHFSHKVNDMNQSPTPFLQQDS